MFLARHGRGHRFSPSTINYRANIDALKRVGVTDIIALSACGSFHRELYPGMFVMIDQFEDRTYAEVGAALAMSPKAAKSLLYRARNQLRASLGPLMHGESRPD